MICLVWDRIQTGMTEYSAVEHLDRLAVEGYSGYEDDSLTV